MDTSDGELILARPSLFSIESTVKDLMEKTGEDREDEEEAEDTETSEVAGDSGGDMGEEHSLELDLKLRSSGTQSASAASYFTSCLTGVV